MTMDTQKLREMATLDYELPKTIVDAVSGAADHIDAQAAEIARLRVALTTINEWPITSPLNMDAHNMRVVARAALSGEGK